MKYFIVLFFFSLQIKISYNSCLTISIFLPLSPSLYGFCPYHSITGLSHEWTYLAKSNDKFLVLILFNFSVVIGTTHYSFLLDSLSSFSFHDTLISWFFFLLQWLHLRGPYRVPPNLSHVGCLSLKDSLWWHPGLSIIIPTYHISPLPYSRHSIKVSL